MIIHCCIWEEHPRISKNQSFRKKICGKVFLHIEPWIEWVKNLRHKVFNMQQTSCILSKKAAAPGNAKRHRAQIALVLEHQYDCRFSLRIAKQFHMMQMSNSRCFEDSFQNTRLFMSKKGWEKKDYSSQWKWQGHTSDSLFHQSHPEHKSHHWALLLQHRNAGECRQQRGATVSYWVKHRAQPL